MTKKKQGEHTKSLAVLVVGFTVKRSGDRRNEYRFALPHAARLGGVMGTVDDLSPSGLSFYGVLGQVRAGERLPVTVYLPDGQFDAVLEIRALMHAKDGAKKYVHSVGGEFQALPAGAVQRFEQFLYGSDTQWRVHYYHEASLTPLQRLGLVDRPQREAGPIQHWAGCEVAADSSGAGGHLVGLASTQAVEGKIHLLVHQPLELDRRYVIQTHARAGLRTLSATAGDSESISTGLGALYLYHMTLLPTPPAASAQPQPAAIAA